MVKPTLRTKSIGFKVKENEYTQLDAAAQTTGRSLGEWCREVLLARGERPGAEGRCRFGRHRPGGSPGGVRGAAGDPAQCALQASERQDPYGSGYARADRPGRFGRAEEGTRAVSEGGTAGNAARRKIVIVFVVPPSIKRNRHYKNGQPFRPKFRLLSMPPGRNGPSQSAELEMQPV
jgi:hypothetical protein